MFIKWCFKIYFKTKHKQEWIVTAAYFINLNIISINCKKEKPVKQ